MAKHLIIKFLLIVIYSNALNAQISSLSNKDTSIFITVYDYDLEAIEQGYLITGKENITHFYNSIEYLAIVNEFTEKETDYMIHLQAKDSIEFIAMYGDCSNIITPYQYTLKKYCPLKFSANKIESVIEKATKLKINSLNFKNLTKARATLDSIKNTNYFVRENINYWYKWNYSFDFTTQIRSDFESIEYQKKYIETYFKSFFNEEIEVILVELSSPKTDLNIKVYSKTIPNFDKLHYEFKYKSYTDNEKNPIDITYWYW
ncbi:MAG: hypothetical protein RLZZ175_214 [Bacteroidota bacterium]|jgi:hypothetical protein